MPAAKKARATIEEEPGPATKKSRVSRRSEMVVLPATPTPAKAKYDPFIL